jgi:hypothetical protein
MHCMWSLHWNWNNKKKELPSSHSMCDASYSCCLCFFLSLSHTWIHDHPLHCTCFNSPQNKPLLTLLFNSNIIINLLPMDSNTILDYALFQLTPTRTRFVSHHYMTTHVAIFSYFIVSFLKICSFSQITYWVVLLLLQIWAFSL